MSTFTDRAKNREYVARHRAKRRGVEYAPPAARLCSTCGCRLSKYAEPHETLCAPCWEASDPSVEECIAETTPRERRTTTGAVRGIRCKRGHDLDETGEMHNSGNGRMARRCGACRKINQRAASARRKEKTAA